MKIIAEDAIYQDGKLEDIFGNEIRIREKAEIKIIGLEEDFLPEEIFAKSSSALKKEIENRKYSGFEMICPSGSFLYFQLRKNEKILKVMLMEDLYLIYKNQLSEERQISLYSCVSKIVNEPFIKVSHSLSDLYKNTYIHYYDNLGAPSANAFFEFYTDESRQHSLDELRNKWKNDLNKNKKKQEDKNGFKRSNYTQL